MARKPSTKTTEQVAWQRLRRAFGWRRSRAQIAAAVLLAMLGFAASVQVQAVRADNDYSSSSRTELVQYLDTLQNHSERLEDQISELERNRSNLVSGANRTKEAVEQAQERVRMLGILAGTLPAHGPGIRLTLPDTPTPVTAGDVINAIEELRDAGAEAIEINDRVRIVAGSYILDDKEEVALQVDGTLLRPPYVIDAIGDPEALGKAMTIPGGVSDKITELGGQAEIDRRQNIQIESLHTEKKPEYAEPAEPGK